MSIITILGIAVGLAIDAFAVAVASGTVLPRITARHYFRLSFHFALFQALMPTIGYLAGKPVSTYAAAWDHWIALALLSFVGGKMLWKPSAREGRELKGDPTRGILLVILSIATSIDALAVGFSLGILGGTILLPALIIGLVAGALTVLGMKIGQRVGPIFGQWVERLGGLILIGVGVKIVIEHLFFQSV